jgi:hypothetical protein
MAVPVGSAYAEFYLAYKDLQGDVDAIKGSLGELRKANDELLESIRGTGAGMAGALRDLQNDVKTLKPLDPIVEGAKEAKKALGKEGVAGEIRKDVGAELRGLKAMLEQHNTYGPIVKQAKAAAAAADQLTEKLQELEAQQRAAKGTGLSREDLNVFFDEQGQTRDSVIVPRALASFEEQQKKHLQRPFGRVSSGVVQTTRIQNLLENAPRGTEAAQIFADSGDVQAAKDLAERAREAHERVAALKREIADLRAELTKSGKVKLDLGSAFIDADQALSIYKASQQEVVALNKEIERTQKEIRAASRDVKAAQKDAAKAVEAEDFVAYAEAEARAEKATESLEQAEAKLVGQQAALEQANIQLAEATDIATYAQERLNKAIGAEPRKRRRSEGGGRDVDAPALDEQIEKDRASRRRINEEQKSHAMELARIKATGEVQAANIATENTGKIQAARIEAEGIVEAERLRSEAAVTNVAKEYAAAVEKAQIESVGKVERERIAAADRQQRQQKKIVADAEKQGLASFTRLQTVQIAAANKIAVVQERFRLRAEERAQKAAAKAAAGTTGGGGAAGGRGTGLTDLEAANVARLRAIGTERTYAQALDIVRRRMADVNTTLLQRTNLERLQARITQQVGRLNRDTGGNFLTRARGQWIEFAGAMGLATSVAEGFAMALRSIKQGFDTFRNTEETTRTLGVFLNSVDRGNRVMEGAIQFGRQYGFVQQEMTQAASTLAPQIRLSNVALEKQLEIVARLTSRQPSQGFEGAAFAIGELAAGDIQSMRDRFNIPGEAARRMKADVEAGMDVFVVLDQTLNRLGVTNEVLGQRMEGTNGQVRTLAAGWDQYRVALGEALGAGGGILAFFGRLFSMAAQATRIMILLGRVSVQWVKDFAATIENIPAPIRALIAGILGIGPAFTAAQARADAFEDQLRTMADGSSLASDEVAHIADAVSVAGNRFSQGMISAAGYAAELRKIAESSNIDLSNVKTPAFGNDLEKASAALQEYQNQMARDPNFAAKNLPQIIAVAQEVARLKALSPVEITVQMRTDFMQAGLQALQSITTESRRATREITDLDEDYNKSVAEGGRERVRIWVDAARDISRATADFRAGEERADRDFNQGQTRQARDFQRGLDRSDRDFNQGRARQARDFQRGLDRSDRDFRQSQQRSYAEYLAGIQRMTRDFNQSQAEQLADFGRSQERSRQAFLRSEATAERDYNRDRARALRDYEQEERKAETEHADELVKIREDADEKLIEIQRNTRDQLQRLQRDFDVDRRRASEDYELERAVLLAEGRLAEARVLESRFRVEQRRAEEDLSRGRSDVVDEGDKSTAETISDREKALAEARTTYDLQRQERQAAWNQMRADQQADYDLARQDAQAAYDLQQQEAAADFALSRERAQAAHAQQLADAQAAYVKSRDEAIAARKQARDDAIADNELANADANADRAQARQDALDDQAQARQDAIDDRNQARTDAQTDHAKAMQDREQQAREQQALLDQKLGEQEDTYKTTRQRILDDLDLFVKEERRKLNETAQDMIKVRQLVEAGIPEEQAQLIVAVQRNNQEWRRVLGDMGKIAGMEGITAGVSWMAQLGQALIEGAKAVDRILQPDNRGGLPYPGYSAPAQRPAPPHIGLPHAPPPVPGASGGGGGAWANAYELPVSMRSTQQAAQRPIVIQINAPVEMDGRTVGQMVAPHVAHQFEGDLEVTAQVIEGAYTPGVSQAAFRRPS